MTSPHFSGRVLRALQGTLALLLVLAAQGEARFYEDAPHVLALANSSEYEAQVLGVPCVWVVQFYASAPGACPACVADAPAFARAARSLAGAARFAAVDCSAEQGRALCDALAVHRHPTTLLYAADTDGVDWAAATLRRARPADVSAAAAAPRLLADAVLSVVPDTCVRLRALRDSWLAGPAYAARPRLVLFAARPGPVAPPALRGLALEYAGRINVAVVFPPSGSASGSSGKSDGKTNDDYQQLCDAFHVKRVPAARLLLPGDKPEDALALDSADAAHPVGGAALRTFVEPHAGLPLLQRFRERWALRHLESVAEWRRHCSSGRNSKDDEDEVDNDDYEDVLGGVTAEHLCVLATIAPAGNEYLREYNVLNRLAIKYRGRAQFFFALVGEQFDAGSSNMDSSITVHALGAHGSVVRCEAREFTGDALSQWLDAIFAGSVRGSPATALPHDNVLRALALGEELPQQLDVDVVVDHDEL